MGSTLAKQVHGRCTICTAFYNGRFGEIPTTTVANLYKRKIWLRQYPAGVPAEPVVPESTVLTLLEEAGKRHAHRPAVHFYGTALTYRRLRWEVERFASGLVALGVHKGDRVGLCLANTPQFVIAYLGALRAGAVAVALNPFQPRAQLAFQLEQSGAGCVVCQDLFYPALERSGANPGEVVWAPVREYLPLWRRWPVQRQPTPRRPAITTFGSLCRARTLGNLPEPGPQDPAVLAYTQGLDGPPQPVLLTHEHLMAAVARWRSFWPGLEEGREVIAALLPLYRVPVQSSTLLLSLSLKATLVLFTSPDLNDILPAARYQQVTVFPGEPATFIALGNHPRTRWVPWRRMKLILAEGEPLPEEVARRWEEHTGTLIHEAYGATEAAGLTHCTPLHRLRPGSFGVPLPGIEAQVVHPRTPHPLPPGQIGELWIGGQSLPTGNWGGNRSAAFVEREGRTWFRTGDLVRMDDAGYFYYYDRLGGLVLHGDEDIYLREIEEALGEHPGVKAAAVVPTLGDGGTLALQAFVVPRSGGTSLPSEEALRAYLRDKLPPSKVPHRLEFRAELPLSPAGRVLRSLVSKEGM